MEHTAKIDELEQPEMESGNEGGEEATTGVGEKSSL